MIGILNYGAGNQFSVWNALSSIGVDKKMIVDNPQDLKRISGLIVPGVGNFGAAMENLCRRGFIEPLLMFIREWRRPYLGICLGMQLLFSQSEESARSGLGIFPEKIVRFTRGKVPLIGWNQVEILQFNPLFWGLDESTYFYFVHSYYLSEAESCVARAYYYRQFVAAINQENVSAVQFHPEKSGPAGLKLLANWCKNGCA